MRALFFVFSFLTVAVFGDDSRAEDDISSSAPYLSGNTFRSICDHYFDEYDAEMDPAQVKRGDIVFVKSDFLEDYFKFIHEGISHPYILVSHNSDHGVEERYRKYLDEGKVFQWFGQNCKEFTHNRLHPIPIGIANKRWRHGRVNVFDRMRGLRSEGRRKYFVTYLGVSNTNPSVRNRSDAYFKRMKWCVKVGRIAHGKYLRRMGMSTFTICPEGNGLDTHRIWEALYMGAIPVVIHSNGDEMFEGLPVMLVNAWEEVTPESLNRYLRDLEGKEIREERIFADYWLGKIRRAQQECRSSDVGAQRARVDEEDLSSSTPYISGNSFRVFCNHHFDKNCQAFNPKQVERGDTVFVEGEALDRFFFSPRIDRLSLCVS